MRVAHVVPTYYPATRYGGPIRSVHGLCKALVDLGHDVSVYTTNVDGNGSLSGDYGKNTDLDGVKVNYYECGVGRRIYRAPKLAADLSECIMVYDVIHLHSVFLWPTYVAARLANGGNIPYVISPRGMLVPELIRRRGRIRKLLWISLVERKSLEQAAMVHVTSDLERVELQSFNFRLKNVVVVPNGVSMPKRTQSNGGDIRGSLVSVVLFLGRINWKKGLDRLIESIPHTKTKCQFLFAGNDDEGYSEILREKAERLGVSERVEFVGEVDDDQKWILLSQATVVVLPSYQENFGNVVLEAMATSKPVLVTAEVGAASIVEEARAGIVTEGEPTDIAAAIDKLVSNPGLCRDMGARGCITVNQRYSWRYIAEHMLGQYQKIINLVSR
ncbi:glycosyltransferase [Pseudomonadota bacterium]